MIEAPFTLLDEQVKAVIAMHITLGLVPEALNRLTVIDALDEQFRIVDPAVMEIGTVQNIIGTEPVGVDDGSRPQPVPHDWGKRVCTSLGMAKHKHFHPTSIARRPKPYPLRHDRVYLSYIRPNSFQRLQTRRPSGSALI